MAMEAMTQVIGYSIALIVLMLIIKGASYLARYIDGEDKY